VPVRSPYVVNLTVVDQPRCGRPRIFPATAVAEVKALACELPARTGMQLARWSCPELAEQARLRGIVEQVSPSTVRRWLAADALKPWQHRSWIFPRDPHFALKAARGAGSVCPRVGGRASPAVDADLRKRMVDAAVTAAEGPAPWLRR
jgi:hypothetical protein